MTLDRRRAAHFRVVGRLDMASRVIEGTVTIENGIFRVRPLRRRKFYDLPLSTVADMVCQRMIKAETFRARLEKAAKRRARRGR